MQKRNVLQFKFFASGVFWANLNFSFPRVPRVASLPFFLVLVVKEKFKLSPKYLLSFRARFGFILFHRRENQNHLKSAARCTNVLVRYDLEFKNFFINISASVKIVLFLGESFNAILQSYIAFSFLPFRI